MKDLSSESDVKKQQYNPTKQSPLQIKFLFLIQERMNKKEDSVLNLLGSGTILTISGWDGRLWKSQWQFCKE